MRKTVGTILVVAGLLSGFQVAEATPDVGTMACEMSVRPPIKDGNIVSTIGSSAGCANSIQFRVVLQGKLPFPLPGWQDLDDVFWNGDATSQKASIRCSGTRRYRAIIDARPGGSETSPERTFSC